jgi:hypothetical protein
MQTDARAGKFSADRKNPIPGGRLMPAAFYGPGARVMDKSVNPWHFFRIRRMMKVRNAPGAAAAAV